MVNVAADPRHKIAKKRLRAFAGKLMADYGYGENYTLNIVFVGSRKMRDIAKKYKSSSKLHPVLSFSYLNKHGQIDETSENKLIGEIFICYPQAVLLAAERQKRVDNMLEELIEHAVKTIIT